MLHFLVSIFLCIASAHALDIDANYYKNHSAHQQKYAEETFGLLDFTGSETVLDVGCGDGKITYALTTLLPQGQVKGIDISPAMILLAQELFDDVPNLSFERCGSLALNDANTYDWITSFCCLHWVREPSLALRNFYRALKPQGRALILAFPKEGPNHDYLYDTLAEPQWAPYRAFAAANSWRSVAEYQELAKQAGFEVIHTETCEREVLYENKEAVRAYMRGWIHCFLPVSETLTEAFIEDSLRHLPAHSTDYGDGRIGLTYYTFTLLLAK